MPADYQSTARALALPIDDEDPISSPHLTSDPPWRRRRQSSNVNNSHPLDLSQASYRERAQYEVDRLTRRLQTTYRRLSPRQRILLVLAGIASFILGILFLVFVHQIFEYLKEGGEKWKNLRGGWCILWALTFAVAFPPMIGYSLCATLAGFIYGMPNGWFIVASATIAGSTCSFLASRTILSGYVHRLLANDTRFAAISLTLKHDGLKLLCMIRLCPLPYSLSNGAIATVPTVSISNFALATALATPKIMIAVWVNSRVAAMTGKDGEKMDTTTKIINILSIVFGITLGIVTGVVIYRQTKKRARELEAQEETAAAGGGDGGIGAGSVPTAPGLGTGRPHGTGSLAANGATGGYSDNLTDLEAGGKDHVNLREHHGSHGNSDQGEYRDYLSDDEEDAHEVAFRDADSSEDEGRV